MKINTNQSSQYISNIDVKPRVTDKKDSPSTAKVFLSTSVQACKSSSSSSIDNSPFDAKKVAQIKSAIANGEFKVDPSKVANGLIKSMQHGLVSA